MTGKTPKHLRHRRCGVKGRYMARALLGYVGSASEQTLTLEVVRLRRRVEELETEVAELRSTHRQELDPALDMELHRLAEGAAPALA
jgi:hypothetical protein